MNLVSVLRDGFASVDGSTMRANCTCTLIRAKDKVNIIVDTRTAWDGEDITQVLQIYFHPLSSIRIAV